MGNLWVRVGKKKVLLRGRCFEGTEESAEHHGGVHRKGRMNMLGLESKKGTGHGFHCKRVKKLCTSVGEDSSGARKRGRVNNVPACDGKKRKSSGGETSHPQGGSAPASMNFFFVGDTESK